KHFEVKTTECLLKVPFPVLTFSADEEHVSLVKAVNDVDDRSGLIRKIVDEDYQGVLYKINRFGGASRLNAAEYGAMKHVDAPFREIEPNSAQNGCLSRSGVVCDNEDVLV